MLFSVVIWKYKQRYICSADQEDVLVIVNALYGFVDSNMHVLRDGMAFIY